MSTKFAERVTPMGIPSTRLDDLPDLIEVQKKSFEWFLRYRYSKAGKNVKIFNMKDIMLQEE